MSIAIKEMDRVELFNLERLAYILKGLSAAELETLEFLLDEMLFGASISRSRNWKKGKGYQLTSGE